MKTIYKYPLVIEPFEYIIEIDLPEDAKILTVQNQNKIPTIWVLLDTDKPKVKRSFKIIGTGHKIDKTISLNYIGTIQNESILGSLVWHLFEIIPK